MLHVARRQGLSLCVTVGCQETFSYAVQTNDRQRYRLSCETRHEHMSYRGKIYRPSGTIAKQHDYKEVSVCVSKSKVHLLSLRSSINRGRMYLERYSEIHKFEVLYYTVQHTQSYITNRRLFVYFFHFYRCSHACAFQTINLLTVEFGFKNLSRDK